MKQIAKVVLTIFLALSALSLNAQVFGKGKPGYITLKNGKTLTGYVKKGVESSTKGLLSVRFSKEVDGKYKKYKLKKKLIGYSLNGNAYVKANIVTSLLGFRKDIFCELLYKGPIFTVVADPFDNSNVGVGVSLISGESNSKTKYHISKNNAKKYVKVERLFYKKGITKLCNDSSAWNEAVAADKEWLRFSNVITNLKLYEEKAN